MEPMVDDFEDIFAWNRYLVQPTPVQIQRAETQSYNQLPTPDGDGHPVRPSGKAPNPSTQPYPTPPSTTERARGAEHAQDIEASIDHEIRSDDGHAVRLSGKAPSPSTQPYPTPPSTTERACGAEHAQDIEASIDHEIRSDDIETSGIMDVSLLAIVNELRSLTHVRNLTGQFDHTHKRLRAFGGYSRVFVTHWVVPCEQVKMRVSIWS